MKTKLLIIFSGGFFFCNAKAQTSSTTSTNTVTVNGSYVANTYIYVHPYIPGSTANFDSAIKFRLNKGTKFFVNQIITTNSTTAGYVISIWNFNKDTLAKNTFYKSLTNAKAAQNNPQVILKQAVTEKASLLAAAEADSIKKSQDIQALKSANADAQLALNNARASFFSSSLYYDAKKNIPAAQLNASNNRPKPEVYSFQATQSSALTQTAEESTPSVALQNELIEKSLHLPVVANSAFEKVKQNYLKAKTEADVSEKKVADEEASFRAAVATLPVFQTALKTAQANYNNSGSQTAQPKNDKAYLIKKPQVGETLDDVTGDTNPAAPYDQLAYLDSWANGWQFYMTASDFSNNSTLIYPSSFKFTWGFLTLPLKMRFDNKLPGGHFNFEQNLNFGLTLGIKQQIISKSDVSWNYLAGISVVNVPLNDAILGTSAIPANAVAGTPAVPAVVATPATSTTAISMSGGVMFQYDKFQIGTFLGWDFAGDHANKFAYQGKMWLGFAIGISLFGEGKTTATTQTQK